MKVLIFLQGEGRGHMTQALAVSKILREDGHTITGLIIGKVSVRGIPDFFKSEDAFIGSYPTPEFFYTKSKKKVSITRTIINNLSPAKIYTFFSSLRYIDKLLAEHKPNLVINFYEPIFGLYTLLYRPKVKIVSIAHQFMVFAKGSYYDKSRIKKSSLRFLSAICKYKSNLTLALSVYPWESSKNDFKVIPPILREDVKKLKPYDGGYLLCYLVNSCLASDLITWSYLNQDVKVHVFVDNIAALDIFPYSENLHFHRIDDKEFLKYLEGCSGLLTTAGYETICEAAFLGKAVLMTPAHLEQEINAHEFSLLNLGVISKDINPSLLVEHIKKNGIVSNDSFTLRNRVLSADKELIDAINYIAY